jgi:hypothetical protein
MAHGRARSERKERQWRRWIDQWRASGLSVRDFFTDTPFFASTVRLDPRLRRRGRTSSPTLLFLHQNAVRPPLRPPSRMGRECNRTCSTVARGATLSREEVEECLTRGA